MSDSTIWHPANAGTDSRPVIWKLEGNQVLVVVGSIAAAIAVFRFLAEAGVDLVSGLLLAGTFPAAALFVVLKFVAGKPPSFLWDFLHWHWLMLVQPSQPLAQAPTQADQ